METKEKHFAEKKSPTNSDILEQKMRTYFWKAVDT